MLKTIAVTVIAGLLVGLLLPFAVFGSHEAAGRIARRDGPRAEVDLQTHPVAAPQIVPERRIPQATNYTALASTYSRENAWSKKSSRRFKVRRAKRVRRLEPAVQHRLATEDRSAFEAADRMLRAERAGA